MAEDGKTYVFGNDSQVPAWMAMNNGGLFGGNAWGGGIVGFILGLLFGNGGLGGFGGFGGGSAAAALGAQANTNNSTDLILSAINGTVYGLYNNKLMRVTSGTIRAGRCYLLTNETQARELSIVFDGELTGISHVTQDNHPALDDNNWYTLDGRKLQKKPVKKGIYIKKGHKVVINNK